MECVQRERSDSRSIETGVCVSHSLFHCPPASHTHPRTRSRRMQKNGSINHKNPPFFHAYRRGTRVWCGGFSSLGNSVCQSRKDPPHHPHVTHSFHPLIPCERSERSERREHGRDGVDGGKDSLSLDTSITFILTINPIPTHSLRRE